MQLSLYCLSATVVQLCVVEKGLSKHYPTLNEIGVTELLDLTLITSDEIESLGMSKFEIKKFALLVDMAHVEAELNRVGELFQGG